MAIAISGQVLNLHSTSLASETIILHHAAMLSSEQFLAYLVPIPVP